MELIDISDEEAEARLKRRSEKLKEGPLSATKAHEQTLAYLRGVDTLIAENDKRVKMKRKICLPNGDIRTQVLDAIISDPAKDEIRWTNLPARKPRKLALYAVRTQWNNVFYAERRILFSRDGFSQAAWDRAVAIGEIPSDRKAFNDSLMANVPPEVDPNDQSQWTKLAVPGE